MLTLRKAYAEAATKLSRDERLNWVRLGMQVFLRPGRRWTAALSRAEQGRSREQLVAFQRSQTLPSNTR